MATEKPKAKKFSEVFPYLRSLRSILVIVIALAFSCIASIWSGRTAEAQAKSRILELAVQVSNTITTERLRAISFTPNDASNPGYHRLCRQMRDFGESIGRPNIYTIAKRGNEFRFGPEGLSPDSPLASKPGDVYQHPPRGLAKLFEKGSSPGSFGPYSDEYGSFISGFSQVFDPLKGEVIAIVGVDMTASEFNSLVLSGYLAPLPYAMAILAIILYGFHVIGRRRSSIEGASFQRHAELLIVAATGVTLTAAMTHLIYARETVTRKEVFGRLAYEHANSLESSIRTTRERLEDIARFVENKPDSSQSEFSSFSAPFAKSPAAVAFGWAKDQEGGACRVCHVEPLAGNGYLSGFDLNSAPQIAKAIDDARSASLPAATGAIPFGGSSSFDSIVALCPIKNIHNGRDLSFAIVHPQRLLEDSMSRMLKLSAMLNIRLREIKPSAEGEVLASWPAKEAFSRKAFPWETAWKSLAASYPIFIFGKSYAAEISPSREFMEMYPARGAQLVAFFGIILTMMSAALVQSMKRRRESLEKLVLDRTRELDAERARLLNVLEGMDAGTWELDLTTGSLSFNERWAEIPGYSKEDLGAMDKDRWLSLCHPDDLPNVVSSLDGHLQGRSASYSVECRARAKSGEWTWIHERGKVLERGANGSSLKMFGTRTAIGGRKLMEWKLREGEALWHSLIDNIAVGVIIVDPETRVIEEANPTAARLFGAEIGKIQGHVCHRFLCPAEERSCPVLDLGQDVDESERRLLRSDGSSIPVLKSVKRIFVNGKERLLESFIDISKRKAAEEALKLSEERFRRLFTEMLDGYALHEAICDADGAPHDYRYLEVNPAFETISGLTRENIVGKTMLDILPDMNSCHMRALAAVVSSGKSESFDYYSKTFEKHLEVVAFRPAPGQLATITTDMTLRKRLEAEAELQRHQLIQADKMKALGILVSGVAHEINNPTNFIMLNTPLIREAWNSILPELERKFAEKGDFEVAELPYSEVRAMIPCLFDGIEDGAKRIKSIVAGLRDFAMPDASSGSEHIDVNKALENSLSLLSHMLNKATKSLSVVYSAKPAKVKGSAQKIEQVMINVIQNAAQALPNPGRGINIETSVESGMVLVKVQDEGIGISEGNLPNIMNPFFTTKRDSGGTGLGLSISHEIMRELGGRMEISSKEGMGTTVRVILPQAN